MAEIWKDITGFEGRYQVSSYGRVKALSFMQRYLLRNGAEAFRKTRERIVATQAINSGYLIVHLHKDNKRTARGARKAHRTVRATFIRSRA